MVAGLFGPMVKRYITKNETLQTPIFLKEDNERKHEKVCRGSMRKEQGENGKGGQR